MNRKRWMALALSGILLCTGTACGGKSTDASEQKNAGKSDTENAYNADDMKMDTVIMAVGNEEVTLNEVLFYVYQLKASYDGSLSSDVWGYDYGKGKTIESFTKKELMKEIAQIKIICQEAEKQGHELTEEEANEASVQAGKFVEALPESAEEYQLTRKLVEKIYKEHALAKKMYDVVGGTIDTKVSDADAQQVKVAYIKVATTKTDKDGNEADLSEDEKASAKQRAEDLRQKAADTQDFLTFAKENSDEDQVEMTIGNDSKLEGLLDTALTLKAGEMSDVLETYSGYYILYCEEPYDKEKSTQYKEAILANREKNAFIKAYAEWKKDYKIVVSETLLEEISL